ncbi:MAG: leucine--tRNA ligase [bacterium]|nr:leucine--tRNA ligase [bacterium]
MYPHKKIEKKWQEYWAKNQTFRASESENKEKCYILDMFPYASSDGLHVGHPRGYTATDIYSRYLRMCGYDVLHPIGWDAFGLPAENFAIKKGIHPHETTQNSIANFHKQIQSLGFSYDWDREIDTSSPQYYKWTQWLFLQLYKKGLAYKAKAPVNWCEHCQTVLANEQVVANCCERCKNPVIQKLLEQWFFKVTNYADELITGLDDLDWPESIKTIQRNWIGKSEGAIITFPIKDTDILIRAFTTRADTLFGVSALVIAPEHPLLSSLNIHNQEELDDYIAKSKHKSDLQRTFLDKEKTGVRLDGVNAINPANNEEIPIFVADYVLGSYGTGAIMSVPAHDARDFEFAKKYDLPIKDVIMPSVVEDKISEAYIGEGVLVNSGKFDGMISQEARVAITKKIKGETTTTYRMRDWLVSRQRYWGSPIPIINCEKCGLVPVPEVDLPVLLPTDVDFRPTGESPLVASKTFHDVKCPTCNCPARRESDTMDTFVCSSWYYLRYISPHENDIPFDQSAIQHWMPVDLYIGGVEHAVLHLLYARFITKALRDMKFLKFDEPFLKLRNQGMILGEDGEKMSKSRGNVINPDTINEEYGADSLRIYEMFLGPLNDVMPWNTRSISGVRRFLDKIWTMYHTAIHADLPEKQTDPTLIKIINKTIKKVSSDIESMSFNTAISTMMICVNAMHKVQTTGHTIARDTLESFAVLLSPFAPHMAEELWELLGHADGITYTTWPVYDEALTKDITVTVAVQINGKSRGQICTPPDATQDEVQTLALADEAIKKWTNGKEIKKVIFVPGRLINFVII